VTSETCNRVVWIVDDAESVRKSIAAVLATTGIVVRDYGSAEDFLADFEPSEPCCLVVDQHMPGMTGLELVTHLRKQAVAAPVIVITGQGDAVLKEKVLQAGALTLLHKPVDGDELISLIEGVLPPVP
jgi:two-component system CheB/CheR fusion protein